MPLPTSFNINKILAVAGPKGDPGDTGATGPAGSGGTSETDLVATSTFTAAKVFRYSSGQAAIASSNLRNRPFHGVAVNNVSAGATGVFQTDGPMKAAFNLGAGVACAVGVNSSGVPVRATDPTCVSAPNWIGDCDTSGLISVRPRRADARRMTDFGGIPNDTSAGARTANMNAIWMMQMSFAAGTGGDIVIEAGDWYLTSDARDGTFCVHIVRPVNMRGEGSSRNLTSTRLICPDGIGGVRSWTGGQAGIPDATPLADGSGGTLDSLYWAGEGSMGTITAHGLWMGCQLRVDRCYFYQFGGDGIHIVSTGGGFPDGWQLNFTHCNFCNNGIYVKGADTSNGSAYNVDCRNNRAWGIYEHSFLGNSYYEPHTDNNLIGPYSVATLGDQAGITTMINRYSEADQLPSESGNGFMIGGNEGSDVTTDSVYFGGPSPNRMDPATWASKPRVPAFTATGTNPPRVAIVGVLRSATANFRIEITAGGYPGGYDQFGVSHPSQIMTCRWSNDAGLTWTAATPHRADNPSVYGVAVIDSGLGPEFIFTPYLYNTDNVYTSAGFGGLQAILRTGTNDGSMAPFAWGCLDKNDSNADPNDWCIAYNETTKRWEERWANAYIAREFVGGVALPGPGLELQPLGFWSGTDAHGFRRIGWYDASNVTGDAGWLASNEQRVQWYSIGDTLINYSPTTPFPQGIRAMGKMAYATRGVWTAGQGNWPGVLITPSSPNGYIYRSTKDGTNHASVEPGTPAGTWPTVIGGLTTDGTQVWECYAAAGSTLWESFGSQLETPGSKVCTAGGTITLTELEGQRAVIHLTGSPTADFAVIASVGKAGGWSRTYCNDTGFCATIKATSSDAGELIFSGERVNLTSDGTNVTRVGRRPIRPVKDSSTASFGDVDAKLNSILALLRTARVIDPFVIPASTVLLLDAGSITTPTFTTWTDQSGLGNDLTRHGTIVWGGGTGPNSLPAITSGGAGWLAAATALGLGTTNWTITVVMKVTAGSNQYIAGWGGGSDGTHLINQAGNHRDVLDSGVAELVGGAYTLSTWEIWTVYNDGTNTHLEVNGTPDTLTNAATVALAATGPFALFTSDGIGGGNGVGAISYVIAQNTDIGSTARGIQTTMLRNKYAL